MGNGKKHIVMGTSRGRSAPMGCTIWEFNGQAWEIKTVQAKNGGLPGEPPVVAGRFKGQLRATPCVSPEPELV